MSSPTPKLSTRVEIYLSAKNLKSHDLRSKSDPQAVLYLDGKQVGRTEILMDQSSPDWATRFEADYVFEALQTLRVEVYDIDSSDKKQAQDLSNHDFIGYAEVKMGELVASKGQALNDVRLRKKDGSGFVKGNSDTPSTLTLRYEEVRATGFHAQLKMRFAAEKLPKMDKGWDSVDPLLKIERIREDNQTVLVHKTNTVKQNYNPSWEPFAMSATQFCNGDKKRPMIFKVYDWDKNGTEEYIGEASASLEEMLAQPRLELTLTNPKSADSKKALGKLMLTEFECTEEFTFLDYIKGGMQINVMVAIDFTGSNGDPRHEDSLHYIGGRSPTQYQQVVEVVGNILTPYDTDQLYQVWGFGGVPPGESEARHCFPLTLDGRNSEVAGLQGIVGAYKHSITRVALSGPTYFTEIIQTATAEASEPYSADKQTYSILLILTDGAITDMPSTTRAIGKAADQPLSIVIVGVGNADFKDMNALDGDRLRTARDIVQFVPFNKYKSNTYALAKETLAEIPGQVISYMKSKNIKPMRAVGK